MIENKQMELNKIYQGNTLQILKTFPDDVIDCVVTSPPYWGQRSYQTNPQIWDATEGCQHEWGETIPVRGEKSGKPGPNAIVGAVIISHETRQAKGTNYCQKCNAWKGELGAEPDFRLYIKHLVDIFQEVKRVLKPTGTCFVNIDDTYAGGNQGAGCKNPSAKQKSNHGTEYMFEQEKALTANMDYPDKCRLLIPERFVIAMQEMGWIVRNDIIWTKPNSMPEARQTDLLMTLNIFIS